MRVVPCRAHSPASLHRDFRVRVDVASAPAATAAPDTVIPVQLKGRQRARFVAQLPQHVPALLTTLTAGANAIRAERTGTALALGAAELLVGAWVLLGIASEARHLFGAERRPPAHGATPGSRAESRVDVSGLAAAALGYVEVLRYAQTHGRLALVSPYMLGASASLMLALGGRRRIRRWLRRSPPHLAVTAAGITYRGGRGRRWAAAWSEVAAVEASPGELVLRLRDGRARLLRADEHLGGAGLIAAARSAVWAHAPADVARSLTAESAALHR